ncbi:MAG: protease pro-enzyme activation domain-containing protein [Candidatus Solibacter sp.]
MPYRISLSFFIAGLLIGGLSAQPRLIRGPIQDKNRTQMAGHVHPLARAENDLGELDPAATLPTITLTLEPTAAQQADLQQLLAAQQDPASPQFHRWLTPEDYADRFGASTDDIARITAWLAQHNLRVASVGRSRTSVLFTGLVSDVEEALQIRIHRYSVNGRNHYANASEPSLPVALRAAVRGIHGLNDFRMQPRSVLRRDVEPNYTSTTTGNHYLSPDDFATIYNLKALWSAGFDGRGQKIAIAGQTRIDVTDNQKFRARFAMPSSDPQTILVPNTKDPGVSTDDQGEANLDLEWAGATAPQATIVYVYSNDVMDAVQYAIDQNLAPVLSLSYGLCEPLTLRSDMLTMQRWAQQANVQGMTWVNASGDSGGADCYTGTSTSGIGLAVDSPANIPEVTGIGGTTLREGTGTYWNGSNNASGGSVTSYIPEVVWNDTTVGDPASGGGGASAIFAQPAWQTGFGVPANSARNVPDVSLAASANHDGYMVYSAGQLSVYGGTSAGTPAFAGILALLNQYLVANGAQAAPGLGNVNPRLYALAQAGTGAFHDVTAGDNIVAITCSARARNCTPGSYGYAAGQGYDLASGLGSVDAFNLITSWRAGGTAARATASISLQTSAASIPSSGSITLTATVTGTNGVTPSGAVAFLSATKQIGSATLSGTGASASASIVLAASELVLGTNSIVAQYSGDNSLNANTATTSLTVTVASTTPPAITGLANGASFRQAFAPGMVLTVFGTNLSDTVWSAAAVPLPAQNAGVSVTIGGIAAPLFYTSPGQLNVQIPYEAPLNQALPLVVSNNGRAGSATLTLGAAAPGIFFDGSGALLPVQSVKRGGVVTLYLTGPGAVSPAVATGAAPPAGSTVSQLPVPAQSLGVTIGGVAATVSFAGIPTGLVGVMQVNLQVPANAPLGTIPVIVTVGGVASQAATITVTQ